MNNETVGVEYASYFKLHTKIIPLKIATRTIIIYGSSKESDSLYNFVDITKWIQRTKNWRYYYSIKFSFLNAIDDAKIEYYVRTRIPSRM